jgi:hypothetical protein
VEIEFMDIYAPSNEEKANPLLYADNVRKVIAAKLSAAQGSGLYFLLRCNFMFIRIFFDEHRSLSYKKSIRGY